MCVFTYTRSQKHNKFVRRYSSCRTWWHTRRNQISSFPETDESIQIGEGCQFSRLLAEEVCVSALVMLDIPRSEVVWRVLATHSIRQFLLHFPSRASPCATRFRTSSNTRDTKSKTATSNTLLSHKPRPMLKQRCITHFPQKSRSHFKILGPTSMTCTKFHKEGPQILGAAVRNWVDGRHGAQNSCTPVLYHKILLLSGSRNDSLKFLCFPSLNLHNKPK